MAEAITREKLIELLNEDLSREYQAIIAYVVYSQVLKGAQYMNIAKELEVHAGEELQHALTIAKNIDYLGGMPTNTAKPVKLSEDAETMLRADLDNENETIRNYRDPRQAVRSAAGIRHRRGHRRDPATGAGASGRPGDGARRERARPVQAAQVAGTREQELNRRFRRRSNRRVGVKETLKFFFEVFLLISCPPVRFLISVISAGTPRAVRRQPE